MCVWREIRKECWKREVWYFIKFWDYEVWGIIYVFYDERFNVCFCVCFIWCFVRGRLVFSKYDKGCKIGEWREREVNEKIWSRVWLIILYYFII